MRSVDGPKFDCSQVIAAAERQDVERVARRDYSGRFQEFSGPSLHLDSDTPRDDHEGAYLWITPGTDDREEINDIWGFVIQLVQDAYQEHDIYLVARRRGVGAILGGRPLDTD